MSIITEIVFMKLIEDIRREDFIKIVDNLEERFHKLQEGYIDSELIYINENDEWIMIQHWDSLDNLKQASKRMFTSDITQEYVKTLDPQSVKMLISEQLKAWK